MNKYFMLCVMAASAAQVAAQTEFGNAAKQGHEGAVNELFNIRYHSINPTRLAYNRIQTTGEAFVISHVETFTMLERLAMSIILMYSLGDFTILTV